MWYRVTRNPQEFHRLMGGQRDPRDRGVTDALSRKMISTLSLKDYDWRFDSDGALLAQLRAIPDLKQMIVNA